LTADLKHCTALVGMGMTLTILVTDNNDDDVAEETISPQQDDDNPAISTEHNLYPAMEQLVDDYSQLNIRSREASHLIAQLELGLVTCILHVALYLLLVVADSLVLGQPTMVTSNIGSRTSTYKH
jgi:hypothetical protein